MTEKEKIKQKQHEIIELAKTLCLTKINIEYAQLSEKLIQKLGRKRDVPFKRGNKHIWATAVVNAIGTINFLGDKSFLPYLSLDDLCAFYDTKKNTIGNKSSQIRQLLNLSHFDDEFSTEYIKGNNPFDKIRMDENSLLFMEEEDYEDEEPDESFFGDDLFLGKVAIYVRPKKPFIDWANYVDSKHPMTEDDFFDGNTYLFDDIYNIVDKEDLEEFLKDIYVGIFENELNDIWTDTDDWPQTISLSMFKEWFEYKVSTMVINM